MTFSSGFGSISYAGDGSTVNFPTGFAFVQNSHVKAVLRDTLDVETTWVEATDYTLTGAGNDAGGTLTAIVAPLTGETLVIILDVPFTQEKAFPLGGSFPSTQVEQMGDLGSMQTAKLAEVDNRTLKVPETDTQVGTALDLPIDSTRAGNFLAFDSNGKPIIAAGTSANLGPVSAFIDTLLDDATDIIARATLKAAALEAANTFQAANTYQALATFQADVELADTDATAGAGPDITLARDSASAAAADLLGGLIFQGKNDNATPEDVIYAKLLAAIVDETDGSEDGRLVFQSMIAGALANRLFLGHGLYMAGATGGDQGADTLNAVEIYKNGQATMALTAPVTASGTAVSFTSGIPANAKRITLTPDELSGSGTNLMIVRIGDSGGFEVAGYTAVGGDLDATPAFASRTDGFPFRQTSGAATAFSGRLVLEKQDDANNIWVFGGQVSAGAAMGIGSGRRNLDSDLDRVQIVFTGGDTFDAGTVGLLVEV